MESPTTSPRARVKGTPLWHKGQPTAHLTSPSDFDLHESDTAGPSQSRTGPNNSMILPQPQAPLAIEDVSKELHRIDNSLLNSVSALGRNLGLKQRSCPVSPEPNEILLRMYMRCWGQDWRSRCQALLRENKRSIIDDTMALVSAFIFENVFQSDPPEWIYAPVHPADGPSEDGE